MTIIENVSSSSSHHHHHRITIQRHEWRTRRALSSLGTSSSSSSSRSSSSRNHRKRNLSAVEVRNSGYNFNTNMNTKTLNTTAQLDRHVPIDRYYDNLRQIHKSPNIFIIDDYLTSDECDSIIQAALKSEKLKRSPIAYAGWTNDFKTQIELAARGPAFWFAIINVLYGSQFQGEFGVPILLRGAFSYSFALGCAVLLSLFEKQKKEKELQEMRTSSSCVLSGSSEGEKQLIRKTEKLLIGANATTFEAPTCIRYEPGQRLAAHFDANRGADVEDADRGGQTLATLLVYLNDQTKSGGGETVFNRLGPLKVLPKKGSALLFFPATEAGEFDERVEHEGLEVLGPEDKWICRIWKHEKKVEEPFGLNEGILREILLQ